jgi:hypothetical protein
MNLAILDIHPTERESSDYASTGAVLQMLMRDQIP